ncbi:hypothetical protein Tco_0664332 [Tanacetum coccineum]
MPGRPTKKIVKANRENNSQVNRIPGIRREPEVGNYASARDDGRGSRGGGRGAMGGDRGTISGGKGIKGDGNVGSGSGFISRGHKLMDEGDTSLDRLGQTRNLLAGLVGIHDVNTFKGRLHRHVRFERNEDEDVDMLGLEIG